MTLNTILNFDEGILLEKSHDHATYKLKVEGGDGTASVYSIFPGIEVAKVNISSYQYSSGIVKSENAIEINHCWAGRVECRMKDGCFQYVGEGDIFLRHPQNHWDSIELPLGYYQGFVITIDLDAAPVQWESLLPGMPNNICKTLKRFFLHDECFMIQSKGQIKHIFSGMYSAPKAVRGAYYRLKIMELLLYLYYFDPASEKQVRIYARQQVDIVKQIQKRITEQLSYRFTIEELAREYCISSTALKKHFKDLYGQSLAAFMKEYRIRKAAVLLCETERSIADISISVGYESQSKFTVAFKKLMKVTPLEYRKNHRLMRS
ncbi:AraC family transcriptional regulator [Tissierella praeacuta]|uniref:helix-turn-helix domain-containing protein n=1 Tax=Tissierella praeacuta TaxID=43131 RepID=UPI0033416BF7